MNLFWFLLDFSTSYTTPSLVEGFGNAFFGKIGTGFKGANDSIGDPAYPFKPGQMQNWIWIENYYTSFISCGFMLGLIAGVFFIIISILGTVTHYCFNERIKKDMSCKMGIVICGFISLILVIASTLTVVISHLIAPDINAKSENSEYYKLGKDLIQFYEDLASAQNNMKETTNGAISWVSEVNRLIPSAHVVKKKYFEKSKDEGKTLLDKYFHEDTEVMSNLEKELNGYITETKNKLNPLQQYLTTNVNPHLKAGIFDTKSFVKLQADRKDSLDFYKNSLNEEIYQALITDGKDYLDSITNSSETFYNLQRAFDLFNSRGNPKFTEWINKDFRKFVYAFQIDEEDNVQHRLSNYQKDSTIYLIIGIVGALCTIGGLIFIIVFAFRPYGSMALSGFLAGGGLVVMAFAFGALTGFFVFFGKMNTETNKAFDTKGMQLEDIPAQDQVMIYNIFPCNYNNKNTTIDVMLNFDYVTDKTYSNFEEKISLMDEEIEKIYNRYQVITPMDDPNDRRFLVTFDPDRYPVYVSNPNSEEFLKHSNSVSDQNVMLMVNSKDGKTLKEFFNNVIMNSGDKELINNWKVFYNGCDGGINKIPDSEFFSKLNNVKDNTTYEKCKTETGIKEKIQESELVKALAGMYDSTGSLAKLQEACIPAYDAWVRDRAIAAQISNMLAGKTLEFYQDFKLVAAIYVNYLRTGLSKFPEWNKFNTARKVISSNSCGYVSRSFDVFMEQMLAKAGTVAIIGDFILIAAIVFITILMIIAVIFKKKVGFRSDDDDKSSGYYSDYSGQSNANNNGKISSDSFSDDAPRLTSRGLASQRGMAAQNEFNSQRGMGSDDEFSSQRGMGSQNGYGSQRGPLSSQRGMASRGFNGTPPVRGYGSQRGFAVEQNGSGSGSGSGSGASFGSSSSSSSSDAPPSRFNSARYRSKR